MQRIRELTNRFKLGHFIHFSQNIIVAVLVLVLVKLGLTGVALTLVLISKWRIFAVQPRYWFVNLRANGADIIVGLSLVSILYLMNQNIESENQDLILISQAILAFFYAIWLVYIKPKSSEIFVALQSICALFLGSIALFWVAEMKNLPETAVILMVWMMALIAARHFLSSYEEPLIRAISFGWALIVAQLAWLLNRWEIVYSISGIVLISQFSIVVTVLAFYCGLAYHMEKTQKLSKPKLIKIMSGACAIILMIIILSDWKVDI
ncbi:hypothetical protein DYH10_04330 [Candidatus Saccharibacteria bacterium CPR2]|nr:hypothetical protein [Candidatus Saccharibacteria bacterium CPR2]